MGNHTCKSNEANTFTEIENFKSFHEGIIHSIQFLHSHAIVTGGDDQNVVVTKLNSKNNNNVPPVVLLGHTKSVNSVHVLSSNSFLSASRDLTVRLWSSTNSNSNSNSNSDSDSISKSSPSTQFTEAGQFLGHSLTVTDVSSNEDGSVVVTGGRDYNVKFFDAATFQCISTNKISRNLVTCLDWFKAKGSNQVCQGSEDLRLRVWDIRDSEASCSIEFGRYLYFPLCADTSKCGNFIATSSKGFDGIGCEGRIWDVRSPNEPLHQLHGHQQDAVSCVYLNMDLVNNVNSPLLATCSKDETIRIWNCTTGEQVCRHYEVGSGMFTSVCTNDKGNINIYDENDNHLVALAATTFNGEVYLFSCAGSESSSDQQQSLVSLTLVKRFENQNCEHEKRFPNQI